LEDHRLDAEGQTMSQPETTPPFDAATLRAVEELALEEAVRNHRRRVRYPKLPEIALLRPFCSNDWRDWPWTRPFTTAGYTWACNRNIIVRIPTVKGVPVYEPGATDANPYLDTMLKRRPDILRIWQLSFNEVGTRPLSESRIESKHMRLIERLPSVMIEAEPKPGRPVSFRFEGGEGVMLG
jgi:hypothetical protein